MLKENKIKRILVLFIITIIANACQNYLDIVPDDIATIDDAFDDQNSAESYLYTCYSWMPQLGNIEQNPVFYGGDESYRDVSLIRLPGQDESFFRMQNLQRGSQQADNPYANYWSGGGGNYGGTNLHRGIRDCNVFLDNIDKVLVIDEGVKRQWIAEAKFLKAYYHFYLFRMYGPIIITDINEPVDAAIEDIQKERSTVDECVTYIADLFLEAAEDLPMQIGDQLNELGKPTKASAFALRARVLTMAASPLFNGNEDYSSMVNNDGRRLFPDFDANKWNVAAEACRVAIDTIEGMGIGLYKFNPNDLDLPNNVNLNEVPDEIVNTLTVQQSLSERWTDEKLFVSTNGLASTIQNHAQARTSSQFGTNTNAFAFYSPTLRIAEMFYTKNGVPIEEDKTWPYSTRYELRTYDEDADEDFNANGVPDNKYFIKNRETTVKLHYDRETRFYGSLGFDRGIWYGNPATYNTNGAAAGFEDHYLEARGEEYSGNNIGFGKQSHTGYFAKKLVNYDNVLSFDSNGYTKVNYAFPEIRLADLYLLYAECLNEIDDRNTAYVYIDKVRERANLKGVVESWINYSSNPSKPTTKAGLREIIHQERLIELVFEGQRFWDLKRWKKAEGFLNKAFRGWNIEGTTAEEYYEAPRVLNIPEYSFKDNLWPIETEEMLTNPKLIQNEGWE